MEERTMDMLPSRLDAGRAEAATVYDEYGVVEEWAEYVFRQSCERIVADGHCGNVMCDDCPLCDEQCCGSVTEAEVAKRWLDEHPQEDEA